MSKRFRRDILKLADLSADTIAHKLDISYETADYMIRILMDDREVKKALQEIRRFSLLERK